MLEHHPDVSAHLIECCLLKVRDVDAIDDDAAGIDAIQCVDRSNQRRLSRPAASNDAEDLAALDRKIDAIQSGEGAERAAQAFEPDDVFVLLLLLIAHHQCRLMTLSLKRSISSSCGLNCSNNKFTPASSNRPICSCT